MTKLMKPTTPFLSNARRSTENSGATSTYVNTSVVSGVVFEDVEDGDDEDEESFVSLKNGLYFKSNSRPETSKDGVSRTLEKVAEETVLSILHKNAELCHKLDNSVLDLFYVVANLEDDFSTASSLDIIFIVAKPQRSPNHDFQIQACNELLELSSKTRLNNALELCLKTTNSFQNLDGFSSETSCKDPARLLRLMTSLMEGGNERAANLLSQKAGLTLDATCAT
eukprot:CAMPEP_0114392176 /NCGR_PEP_ID=MMETSP0102-20121206/10624_1 /TAXON_ID=38822 ORGANISM="Pteridomonas danica, Strain PT" /NCGR_SAMPLE_ID=MMETSP0102 /ASSEMBLY_ACC=CAM_ASM_000212 /LENGTH=224 /DNA_ID=CAMNT_0001551269 /DNA_START=91 /DNA_END=761 /DNA_ORIENTATION=-